MKKILYILVFIPVMVLAQSTNQNYVKSVTYKEAGGTSNPSVTQAQVSITYIDGLGRPIQQIAVKQSATGKNIVTPITYDAYGRQDKEYLPIPMNGTSMSYTDNTTIISDPTSYYTNTFGNDGAFRYAEKRFEASPLNRVFEQGAPGNAWQMGNHTIKLDYQTNTTTDVKCYKVVATYNPATKVYDPVLTVGSSTHYLEGTLYKSVIKDENWSSGVLNTTEEFKNQQGQVILKRTYNNIELIGITKHDTYYVYDQFGNLTFVVPPLADNPIHAATREGLCYQYKYDTRNRLVEKKLPGKDVWEYIVYDKLDRVVATGPALAPFTDFIEQNKIGWLITKYDAFNRVVVTGWKEAVINATTRSILQNNYNAAINTNESTTREGTFTEMNGISFAYTNAVLPTSDYHVLTINYYDTYNFTGGPAISDFTVQIDGQNQVYYDAVRKPKGLSTGSWVRVLQKSTDTKAEISYVLYDKKSRPVTQYTANYLDGFTRVDSKLDFVGKPITTITKHKKDTNSTTLEFRENFTYTDQERLLTHTHQILGLNAPELLTHNGYDEMGQLIIKSVGGADISGTTSLQKIDYSYNIRGWLKTINNVEELSIDGPRDLFAFKINYNEVENHVQGVTKLYNGNIAETHWITDSDNIKRNYGYIYDDLNRLLKANYFKRERETHSYDETLTYDRNGNIKTLKRNGFTDSDNLGMTYAIDELDYTYLDDSNRLNSVTDSSMSIDGFKDGHGGANDYDYDDFGNMTIDLNKEIQKLIQYNHLNLPVRIEFGSNGIINYLYNALGVKVAKTVRTNDPNTGTTENTTDYMGGFQYKNNELQFFPTAEGYVSVTDGAKFNYVYNYTDHLGNIRLSYTKAGAELKILEENHYYPFGLKHSNYNVEKVDFKKDETGIFVVLEPVERNKYQYKYNGQEWQDELNLNWYDYQARNYDPAIGRWMNVDPLAETSRRFSPYTYCLNNPIFFIDPDGMQADDWRNKDGKTIYNTDASKGDIGYTEHATKNDKNIGNALQATPTGQKQFDKLVNSEQPTEIVLVNGVGPSKGSEKNVIGNADNGNPNVATDEKGNYVESDVKKSTITVYMGTIDSTMKTNTSGQAGSLYGKSVTGLSFEQILGAVVGHEIEHTTLQNMGLYANNASSAQYEKVPTQVSNAIIDESLEKNKNK